MPSSSNGTKVPHPTQRRIRAFAFDPNISRRIETHDINEVTIKLPWDDSLKSGPVDDHVEVVDYDPASKAFYTPVNLNDKHLLAQDGLPPSEDNPLFHQQMVYAVARTTIRHFELALGRRALWSPRPVKRKGKSKEKFIQRLRIYPHALREANAYYSPVKKALLFGYFPASTTDPGESMPGEMVFTCLSHDIVAHETTHALLDGLHRRFIEPSNVDVWALHEAFADIVALFQHFTYPRVLRHQIARTQGNLEKQSLLAQLAQQFGQAIGHYGALRDALGERDIKTREWKQKIPNPLEIQQTTEPHRRGAILVAAVFDSFLTIYKRRIADLLRIATGGTGVLPPGELHPDLVNRLAQEAAKTSGHILKMCIRALDYCPPVDIDFGDYLRGLITADHDLVKDDRYNYRLAFIEAFRQRGIYPRGVRNLSEESLLWLRPNKKEQRTFQKVFGKGRLNELVPDLSLTTNRKKIFEQTMESRKTLWEWFTDPGTRRAAKASHLVLSAAKRKSFYRNKKGIPRLEVHSVRPAYHVSPEGEPVTELVIEMTQRRRGYYDRDIQKKVDQGKIKPPMPDFIFRGGCTLLIDPDTAEVRYCIYKKIDDETRLNRMRSFLLDDVNPSLRTTLFGDPRHAYFGSICGAKEQKDPTIEPFALLHRTFEELEV